MSYNDLPDDQLVALTAQGGRDAFGALYDRHGSSVYRLALYLLQDRTKAEEITQEVFLDVWLKATFFRPERGPFHAWLMAIAHHRAVDELRRNRRQRDVMAEAGMNAIIEERTRAITADEGAQHSEEAVIVRKSLEVLPSEQKQVVEMAYYQGLTQTELAQRLQQPLGTVKTRMRLAMQKLRTALGAYQEQT